MPGSDNHSTPIFVLGTGRCGSTTLSDILNAHPRILSLSEFISFTGIGPFRYRNPARPKDLEGPQRPAPPHTPHARRRLRRAPLPVRRPGSPVHPRQRAPHPLHHPAAPDRRPRHPIRHSATHRARPTQAIHLPTLPGTIRLDMFRPRPRPLDRAVRRLSALRLHPARGHFPTRGSSTFTATAGTPRSR